MPSATEVHTSDIEKVTKDTSGISKASTDNKEASTIQGEPILGRNMTITGCDDPVPAIKDINLNDESSDYQQYHQPIHLSLNDNAENESEKECGDEKQDMSSADEKTSQTGDINVMSAPIVPKLKYEYDSDQWSPVNRSGRRCYDIRLLMQIKDDPLSKTKPVGVHLELSSIVKQHQKAQPFNPVIRPVNDSLFPNFAKNIGPRNTTPREHKTHKEVRNSNTSGKGNVRVTSSPVATPPQPVIRVSLAREEVKLSQAKDAWKPSRLKNAGLSEEEKQTQELYKTFRGILNKLTPQKFDTLMEKVKGLEISTQSRLAGVIDLVFEKAIDEPNFAETYANMCYKLAAIKVPSESGSPDMYVNFRLLIINKCQNQFVTQKVEESVLKLEREVSECADPIKKKELQLLLEEENRRIRMRSVGNVRFIGELYKLKMLTAKIMVFCMNYLVEKLEEEKLECLCKLLTTIGEQVESEVKEQLELVFKRMQAIVDHKAGAISSRVRFMLKDVIDLRRRRWVPKGGADLQPKTMDQIQREADQHQRNIELMNSVPLSGGYGRRDDEGGRRREGRGERRGGGGADGEWKSPRPYTVDVSKMKAGSLKNLSNIKLAPQHAGWTQGARSAAAPAAPAAPATIGTRNDYSLLEDSPLDPASLRASSDTTSSKKTSSSDKSTVQSKGDSE